MRSSWSRKPAEPRPAAPAALALFVALSVVLLDGFWADGRPQAGTPDAAPSGVIILGGGLDQYVHDIGHGIPPSGAALRIVDGVALWKRFPGAKLIYTGDEGPHRPKAVLLSLGVTEASIVIEPRAKTTAENAVFLARMLEPRPDQSWLLVTSTFHMERALECFREAGFRVTGAPVADVPADRVAERIRNGLHEFGGRIAYGLRGACSAPNAR